MTPILICIIQRKEVTEYSNKAKVVGFRLMDIDTKQVMDVSLKSVKDNLKNGMKILGFNSMGQILNNKVPIDCDGYVMNIEYDTVIETMPNSMVRVSSFDGRVYERRYSDTAILYEGTPQGEEYKVYEYRGKLAKKAKMFKRIYDINELGVCKAREGFDYEDAPEELVIPDGVTSIAEYGFKGVKNVKKLIIPSTVESIGRYAFSNMRDLEVVEIKGKVEVLHIGCFQNCISLKNVTLSSYVRVLEKECFSGCNSLRKIRSLRGSGLESVGYMALPFYCTVERSKFTL